MAAGNWIAYNKFKYNVGAGNINLASDHFRMVLLSSSYTPALTHQTWADMSAAELATSHGYTQNGTLYGNRRHNGRYHKWRAGCDCDWHRSHHDKLDVRY